MNLPCSPVWTVGHHCRQRPTPDLCWEIAEVTTPELSRTWGCTVVRSLGLREANLGSILMSEPLMRCVTLDNALA